MPPAAEKTDVSQKFGLEEAYSLRIRGVKTWYSVSNTFEFIWVRFEWPDQNPPQRDLILREIHKWKDFISCFWFGWEWKLPAAATPCDLLSFGAEIAINFEKVLQLSISTSVEQTKLPVCAHKADYRNPNTNFRLVIQLKYLVTAYTSLTILLCSVDLVLTTVSAEELLMESCTSPHPACGRAKFLKVTSSGVLSAFIEPADKPSSKRPPGLWEQNSNYTENELHPWGVTLLSTIWAAADSDTNSPNKKSAPLAEELFL